jgi:single-stranded DNA-binding protein
VGKQAELASMYLKKGSEIFVQGQKQLKEFTTSEGHRKTYVEVNANLIGFSNL